MQNTAVALGSGTKNGTEVIRHTSHRWSHRELVFLLFVVVKPQWTAPLPLLVQASASGGIKEFHFVTSALGSSRSRGLIRA